MTNYITIDGGTTNTRINLVSDRIIKDTLKFNVGAAAGLENKKLLKDTIKKGIEDIISRNNLKECDILKILASGMITSEGGLCNLPHLVLPCGIDEMSQGMYEAVIDDVSDIPFVFVRGLKTAGTDFPSLDMMRGEETELMGLSDDLQANCLYILPGSHSKLVYVDENNKITDFMTELTGELIAAVSQNTILKGSIDLKSTATNKEFLQLGYKYTKEKGLNNALFKVRTLDKLLGHTNEEVFSFFIGVVLSSEIDNIIASNAKKVIICGKKELKEPTAMLLEMNSDKKIIIVPDNVTEYASSNGVIRIYENSK